MAPPYRMPESGDPATVGPYRVEGVLGEGGMGRVYLGRTPAGVAVALKVMHRADGEFRKRLELAVAAVRQVPGLYTVPVVDADPWAERPWLASAYVDGPSLRHAVTAYGPGSAATVVRLVAGVAEALQSLHAAGVAHGDLKPANVLLTTNGPRLTDYGMPVTQELTGAADVFALGLLAYFAATGREQQPDLAGCPEPLRGIVLACLNEDPRQRPTPAEIVERCQTATYTGPPQYSPSVSGPPGLTRRGLLLATAGFAGVAALGITIPVLLSDSDADTDPQPANSQPRVNGPFRLAATLTGHPASINGLAFSPDGQVLASMSGADIRLWDVASHEQRSVLAGDVKYYFGLEFSPDGRLLAAADDHTVRLWDVASEETRTILTGHTAPVYALAFSPDGQLLASAAEDETVRLWDVASGRPGAVLSGHGANVSKVAFHPGGRLLASCAGRAAFLWDVPSGQLRHVFEEHDGSVRAVTFSPDGKVLAASDGGSGGGRVVFWDTEAIGEQKTVLGGHEDPMDDLAFSPDGRLLATTAEKLKIWDVTGDEPPVILDGGEELGVNEVAFSSSGMLASGGLDAKVRLWKVA
jgi:sugar lactone lactonase YvrE/predicted Ser/Thr protein kinase